MVYKNREYFGAPAEPELHPGTRLEADVAAALGASGEVDAADVEVTVVSGSAVILGGWVTEEDEIRRCIETAKTVPGVRHVDSRISTRNSSGSFSRSL